MKLKILVAAHKEYNVPKDDLYTPLWVGSALKEGCEPEGYLRDDTGDNISSLNPKFCELTALYWGWKNLDTDYLGLVHYRRYFGKKNKGPVSLSEIEDKLNQGLTIVPKKRRYYIETIKSHYSHTHNELHLIKTMEIIKEKYPEYESAFNESLNRTWGYMFNMMIMDRQKLDKYCTWLFDILFELQNRLPEEDSAFDSRLFGRVSEILLNSWIIHNKIEVYEMPYYNSEKTNWFVKGTSFLKAKFFGKKYTKSF